MTAKAAPGYPQAKNQGLIPEFFADEFNVEYQATTLLPRLTTSRFYEKVLEMGDKVTLASLPSFVTRTYKKGQELEIDTPKATSIEMPVDRARYFNFIVDKIDMKQSHLAIGDKYNAKAVDDEQEDVEEEFFESVYTQAHASNQGATAGVKSGAYNLGAPGSPLALTTNNMDSFITSLRAVLGEQNAAKPGKMWVVIPEWARWLLVNSDIKNAAVMGDSKSVMRTGRLGMLDGLTIYTSNLLHTSTTDEDTGTYILAGNMDAISFVSQMKDVEKLKTSKTFGTLFRGLHVYDWSVRKPEGLVMAYCYKG